MTSVTQLARSPGDPELQYKGPSSLTSADQLARGLGWFSLALGAVELLSPGSITRAIGLEGKETLVRGYGLREVAAGVQTLSVDNHVGLASRIAGDMLDIVTLLPALRTSNPKRDNAKLALGAVLAVTILDCLAYGAVTKVHAQDRGERRDYSDRSGLPRGISASRGLAGEKTTSPVRAVA